MILDLQATEIFERNYDSNTRIVINRGGTRSSKTYSLCQMWLVKSYKEKAKRILITRLTFPALRLTAMQDFISILEDYDCKNDFRHNRTYHYFENKYTKTQIHFISSDDPQKVRGQKWDYIQLVEANELPWETFRQYILRLPGRFFLDFNPSESDIWINTELEQKRNDVTVIKSSYLDNPFLEEGIVKEIEYLRDTDLNYWQIYGLGEYGNLRNKVWSGWTQCTPEEFNNASDMDEFFGYDDGFVAPRAIVHMKWHMETLYINQVYYKSYQQLDDCFAALDGAMSTKDTPLYVDPENAASRSELGDQGYNAIKANKKVKWGLNYVRRFNRVKVTNTSVDIWKEYNKFKYQEDHNGKVIEKPVKIDDHLMDAIRYGVVSHLHWVFAS